MTLFSLKSDHCGIEIFEIDTEEEGYTQLKSDHCGIEIRITLITVLIIEN